MIPALEQIAHDERCKGAPLAVYCHLLGVLALHEYRPVKVTSIASALRIKDVTAAWAVRRLVDAGYLERGKAERRVRTYRLAWTVRERECQKKHSNLPAL